MRRRLLAAVVAALLLGLSACAGSTGSGDPGAASSGSASGSPAPSSAAAAFGAYVAIGDSYTSAPFVYLTDVADGCLRSNGNYPSLLAKQIGARLTDVSCSGATTADLTAPQQTFSRTRVPAQLDAVTSRTRLVTVGLGGNDGGLFGSLASGCPIAGPGGQTVTGARDRAGSACGRIDETSADRIIATTGRHLRVTLRAITAKAPDARVVLVGYPRIASTTTTCPRLLPASLADGRRIDAATHRLSDTMRAAAKATGVVFVNMYAASAGHDVCAARSGRTPWINGVMTDVRRAAPLHPFAVEQQAVALAVAKALA